VYKVVFSLVYLLRITTHTDILPSLSLFYLWLGLAYFFIISYVQIMNLLCPVLVSFCSPDFSSYSSSKCGRIEQVDVAKKRYLQFQRVSMKRRNSTEKSANRISNTKVIGSVPHKHWFIEPLWYLHRRTKNKHGYSRNSLGRFKPSPRNVRKKV
jgi:hypothetical protein